MAFEGKVIAITGAGSGMGLSTAQLLASRGAILSLADINASSLSSALATIPHASRHTSTVVDVRSSASVSDWITSTVQCHGKLDGAVNMAGVITPAKPLVDVTDEEWDFVLDVNAKGIFNCVRAQIRAMGGGGSIVNAASVFGQFGAPNNVAYNSSKGAVIQLTRTAAKENEHVRVNAVSPGAMNTPMSQAEKAHGGEERDAKIFAQTAQKRRAEPIEVARVVAFLLSDEASFVTGAIYNVDGGWWC